MRKFREGASRTQLALLPGSIDEYIPKTDIVRYVDTVVEELDLSEIESKYSTFGRPAFQPRMLVKVLVYGKMRGIRSGRELSQATKENFRFIFLANNEKPDFRTINVFRKTFSKELAAILVQTVRIGLHEQIITLNHVSIDGTKLGAFAGRNSFKDPKRLEVDLKELERSLAESIANNMSLDEEEDRIFGDDDDGEASLPKELQDKRALVDKIKRALNHYASFEGDKPKSISLSDPECRYMQSKGINPSFNAQAAVDADSSTVVGAEVVSACCDSSQLAPMLSEIKQTTGFNPKIVSADRGYSRKEDLEELEKRNIDGFIAQRKALGGRFTLKDFQYHEGDDSYACPNDRKLKLRGTNNV